MLRFFLFALFFCSSLIAQSDAEILKRAHNFLQSQIFKVFFKNADAAVVTQKTFEFAKEFNPQIGENLKIIEHSGVPSSIYGFFRKSADENMRQKIFDLALNIKDTARGKQILEIFKTDLILKSTLDELVPIERLYSDYNRLKNTTR